MVTTETRSRALAILVVVSFLLSGFNLYWTAHEVNANTAAQHAQQLRQEREGVLVEAKLCTTLGRLGALKPPAGNPAQNPSRGYEDRLHGVLAQLGTDIGCKP